MKTICIMCPMGCDIEIIENGGELQVSGNTCKRGEVYGKAEYTSPIRMVTSLVKYENGVVSVKTSKPVKKQLISEVLNKIKQIVIVGKVVCGDIVCKDIDGDGTDIIVTANL